MIKNVHRERALEAVSQLEYNALRPRLIIPEYGRYLQKLIDQAIEIEDRTQRNKAAQYIIRVMGEMNPHLRDVPDFQHKLWDQIFIMSDFRIDVDSPYPIPTPELVYLKPTTLDYPQKSPKYRYYGNTIPSMIDIALSWEEGELKSALIWVIANHMKKTYLSWNKETVEDQVIFEHLYDLSDGKIDLKTDGEELTSSQELIKTNQKQTNKFQNPSAITKPFKAGFKKNEVPKKNNFKKR
ncbi:MAG: hypothetical protein CFE24_11830 [Flavobacterium sp. BFFFF2]|nr:MAG: hypothetical protein CFE24_11830 [Flavobacterium sp. BFFFF2]